MTKTFRVGVHIPIKLSVNATPKTLNSWLKNNDGYDGSNDMIETAVPNIDPDRIIWPEDGFHKTKDISFETVVSYINAGRIVIGTH